MISCEDFGHGSEHGVGPSLVDLVGALVGQETSRLDASSHVSQHEGDRLMLVDWDTHRLSFS
jgi:cytochrome c2